MVGQQGLRSRSDFSVRQTVRSSSFFLLSRGQKLMLAFFEQWYRVLDAAQGPSFLANLACMHSLLFPHLLQTTTSLWRSEDAIGSKATTSMPEVR